MRNRRGFIKQAIVGLGFIGLFLKDLFIEPFVIAHDFEKKKKEVSISFTGSDDCIEVSEDDMKLEGVLQYSYLILIGRVN